MTLSAVPTQAGQKPCASGRSRVAADTNRLLHALREAGVEFVVIGGVAALAHGALTPTRDVDIAAPLTEDNLRRLKIVEAELRSIRARRSRA